MEETLRKLRENLTQRNWYKAIIVLEDKVLEEFIVNGIDENFIIGMPKDHFLNGGFGNGLAIKISEILEITIPYIDLRPFDDAQFTLK